MSSILTEPLKINGLISTNKTVLQNLNDLATASGCFLTYDINQGKWAIIINRTGSSVASFNDSNIVGSITVSESGVNELYNSASVEFPDPDLRDETDYVDVVINSADRYPNEVDNNLAIQIDCINNPVQAQYLASIELKQSRLSKIINFSADYTSLGLKAGDLIDVTSSQYGFTNKVFRIIKIEENDEDTIGLNLTALEYSADVYSSSGLTRSERTRATGILIKEQNEQIQTSNDVDTGNQLERLLLANAGAALLKSLFSRILGTNKFGPKETASKNIDKILSNAKAPTLDTITNSGDVCEGGTVTVTVSNSDSVTACDTGCALITVPDLEYDYTITGVTSSDINIPLSGTVTVNKSTHNGSLTIVTSATAGGSSLKTMTVNIGDLSTSVNIHNSPDYNYIVSPSSTTITEGSGVTLTLDTINVPAGTSVPYTITGDTGRVTSPLSGSVTTNNSYQATLSITTNTTSGHTGNDTITVTFAPALSTPCLQNVATITINDSTPFQPPTHCEYVDVPVIWCAQYSGYNGQLEAITAIKTAKFAVPKANEATVNLPLTLTVSKGNPSTITVTSTIAVASSEGLAGIPIGVITSFNTVSPNGLITGTKTTVIGYF